MTRTKINGTIKNVKDSVIPAAADHTVAVPVSVVSVFISSVWLPEFGRHERCSAVDEAL